MSLRRSMIFSLGDALPLDQVDSTALVAYGLRKLRTTYSGPCLRITNNVGAIGDLAFDNTNEISTSSIVSVTTTGGSFTSGFTYTLSAFANGGDVTVRTWYDQSGNSRDISQTTTGSQPYLMLSGSFTNVDGKPSIFTNNTLRFFRNTYTYTTGTSASKFWYYAQDGSVLIAKSNAEYILAQTAYMTDCGSGGGVMWWGYRNIYSSSISQYIATIYQRFRKTYESPANCSNTYYTVGVGSVDGDIEPQLFIYTNNPFTNNYITSFVDNNTATRLNDYTYQIGATENAGTAPVGAYEKVFINGSEKTQFNYVRPRTNIGPLNLFIFNTSASGYNEKIQEVILFDGQNNFSERSVIEKNMGKYYNVTIS